MGFGVWLTGLVGVPVLLQATKIQDEMARLSGFKICVEIEDLVCFFIVMSFGSLTQ
ncbi:hypothetical protein AO372_1802 [Moraxella catarrhalis]|nr:hypothetical protein AO381_1147 [Moraxella catarrhalis]OAV09610.1 hypothetical protein AO378_1289 [Moraxella catarrhalis]OAV10640.1 hypothetical protein AO377_0853 [Moraxella catarrhalis]OAV11948.1 hypothetical protein AO380_0569 [Moraxella catarrhalis]OAV13034.1 hypothetical protein AO375_1660 [Moraxella catarrhalis]